jgi:hypothetical protein
VKRWRLRRLCRELGDLGDLSGRVRHFDRQLVTHCAESFQAGLNPIYLG